MCNWTSIFTICFTSTHSKKPLFPSYRLGEWSINNTYHQPTATNKPNNDNIIRAEKKPNPENIELQTTPMKEVTMYPSFSTVSFFSCPILLSSLPLCGGPYPIRVILYHGQVHPSKLLCCRLSLIADDVVVAMSVVELCSQVFWCIFKSEG